MNVITTSMEAASTSVSTFQAITAVLATTASCWLTMATTAWVRSLFMGLASGDADITLQLHPWEMGNVGRSVGLNQLS